MTVAEFARNAHQLIRLDVGRRHPRAGGGAPQRERAPDASGGPSYYDSSSVELHLAQPHNCSEFVK